MTLNTALYRKAKKSSAHTLLIPMTSFYGGSTFLFTWHELKLTSEKEQEVISWALPSHKFSE